MSITIGRFTFEGPYTSTGPLRHQQGIYSILCQPFFGSPTVVDVGESEDVSARVENHDRQSCWKRNCNAKLSVAVLYTPGYTADQRRAIERGLRQQYNPSCGAR